MKIAFVSLPLPGHLNPMTALARKLKSRGHEIRFIGVPDIESAVCAAGVPFEPYCEEEYPAGSIAKLYAPTAKLHGLDVLRRETQEITPRFLKAALEHLPGKLMKTGFEAVVLDSAHIFLQLAPITLGIPFIQIWNGLHLDSSGITPPCCFSWPHETSPQGLARNMEGLKTVHGLLGPSLAVAMTYATDNGLKIDWTDFNATTSKLAVITQMPGEFDFEGAPRPAYFHYAGPFHDAEGREQVNFQ